LSGWGRHPEYVSDRAGRIQFQLDQVIHQYRRSAQELWKFCAVSGAQVERAVQALELRKAEGEELDSWKIGARRGR
jgi:hypothetical protein